jgi:Flp pilus assembly protein TadD
MDETKPLSELPSEDVDSLYDVIMTLLKEERLDEAHSALLQFARELPDYGHGIVWYELAGTFEQKGDSNAAEAAYRKALELEDNNTMYAFSFAAFLWARKRNNDALRLMKPLRPQAGVGAVPDLENFDLMMGSIERGEDDRLLREYWKRLTR